MPRSLDVACALVALLAAAALAQSPQWQVGAPYAVGAKVAYAGAEYRCLQAHTAQLGWEPSTTLALWSPTATGSFPPAPATIAPTPVPVTAAPVGAGCWPLWSASAIYVGGATVSYGGVNYRAAWWTQGDMPPTHTGSGQPWVPAGACGGAAPATSAPAPRPPTLPPPPPPPATNAPATARPTTARPVTAAPINPAPTNGSLPKRVITGYWQNFNNGATCLRLSAVPSAYNLIAVAFASSTALPGEITFTVDSGLASCLGGYTDEQFISDIRTAHAKGQKVIISIGGELGHLIVNDATSAARFADSAFSVMTRFGFDGVDIDLESGINPGALASGLRLLAAKAPGLVVTTAPQTLDMQTAGSAYMDLSMRIRDLLTISNTQFYNSGSMLGCDGGVYVQGSVDFLTAQACIQLRAGLRPDQIGLGLPASVRGAGSGYIAPSMVVSALRCLALGDQCGAFRPSALAPALRGAMTWSINWDALNGYQWVNTIAAGLAALP